MTPDLNLDEIEARANRATPGPWIPENNSFKRIFHGEHVVCDPYSALPDPKHKSHSILFEQRDANADFIAHARTDIPALIAEVKRLREENERLRDEYREETECGNKIRSIIGHTANALKGRPAPLTQHSWHDLPQVAAKLRAKVAAGDRILHEIACATPKFDDPRLEYVEIQVDRATIAELAAYREGKDGTK